MNLSKQREFFNPSAVQGQVHIVGCGSVGSTVAETLARCGISNMTLWDDDTVVPHNISNQMFRHTDIGKKKVSALHSILAEINPDITISIKDNGWHGESMSGFIFMCVDSIETRKAIFEKHKRSRYVKAMFDFRTMLTGAQHYAADWLDEEQRKILWNSMDFTHEEATESAPTSACGITLGVAPTVRVISALGVCNFINYVKGDGLKRFIQCDNFGFILDAF